MRLDWLLTPVPVSPVLGGLYFTAKSEVAAFHRRFDDALNLPSERVLREDLEGRLDYKLGILDKVYVRAFGSGRFTDWNRRQLPDGTTDPDNMERFLGTVGARAGTQFDAPFVISESGLTLRHVIVPEAGYENRLLDTRDPSSIVQIDEVDTYRKGAFVYGRLRNRLQWSKDPSGKGSKELLDVVLEGRYFPTDERLAPQQRIWGTVFSDARLYLGAEGTLRAIAEVDPNRHRLLRLDTTFTWLGGASSRTSPWTWASTSSRTSRGSSGGASTFASRRPGACASRSSTTSTRRTSCGTASSSGATSTASRSSSRGAGTRSSGTRGSPSRSSPSSRTTRRRRAPPSTSPASERSIQ
jgi:hypothetical protein